MLDSRYENKTLFTLVNDCGFIDQAKIKYANK